MNDPFLNAQEQLRQVAKIIKLDDEILEYLLETHKVLRVRIPVTMDDGSMKVFTGFRSQHNNDLGPYKGGIRFHPNVSESEVKALSMWMSWKCATAGIPLGGGKGGIIVDPAELSKGELERLSRGFIRRIYEIIGDEKDVPAPDVNTTGEIMGWMLDEYEKLVGHKEPGVITGKSLDNFGSKGRTEATGRGGAFVLEELTKRKKLNPKETRMVVQGFGNVGYYFALFAEEMGFKVIAVSDVKGGILNEKGLDIKGVAAHKDKNGSVVGFSGSNEISNEELLLLECEVLVPAALENVVHDGNAKDIKAKFIIEMANGPVTPDAEKILDKKGVMVVPDILANSGGVTVSYFEWLQNRANKYWEEDEVNKKLEDTIKKAFTDSYESMEKHGVNFRMGTYALAVSKVANAAGKNLKK